MTATIESHIFDRGGFSYCSKCDNDIDIFNLEKIKDKNGKMTCPNCNEDLIFGQTSFSNGGSDF